MSASHAIELVLASRNLKKAKEMQELITPRWEPAPEHYRIAVKTLADFPAIPEVEEDAPTFLGNARKKASETASQLGRWVVADDSGLAVDALDGAPGIFSARYAGTHGDDEANNQKLLRELAGLPAEQRGAAFVCGLALADPSGVIRAQVEARCRGRIIESARGISGFGYDPLFLIPEYHKTFAELGETVKHQLSHRSRAFQRLRPLLHTLLVSG